MTNETDPLERINYVDGQRLTAELLQREQDFHIRLRQWLSKSLFTPGVASGLEVDFDEASKTVTVGPGLALDEKGRAIVLLEPTEPRKVQGRYLIISYGEQAYRQAADGCLIGPVDAKGAAVPTAWSGPTVIRQVPILEFVNRPPHEDRLELVLAELAFDGDCEPTGVLSGPSRFAAPRQVADIHTFALEGEKDIDFHNPKVLRFHVHGRRPVSVSLYLQSARFSSLYYSELGRHGHVPGPEAGLGSARSADYAASVPIPDHSHGINHAHSLTNSTINRNKAGNKVSTVSADGALGEVGAPFDALGFSALISPHSGSSTGARWNDVINIDHTHPVDVDVTFAEAGSTSDGGRADARELKAISYIHNLHIRVDGNDVTDDVIDQINNRNIDPWTMLGNGGPGHLLEEKGTGRLRIDMLPNVDIISGKPHTIELFIEQADELLGSGDDTRPNGGKIYYNLYVEAE